MSYDPPKTAAQVPFTPAGTIAADDVQAAIEEVASEAGGGGSSTYKDLLLSVPNGVHWESYPVGITTWTSLPNLTATVDNPTVSASIEYDAEGVYWSGLTNAAAGARSRVSSNAARWVRQADAAVLLKFRLVDLTEMRFYAALTQNLVSSSVTNDEPAGNGVGIQFSPDTLGHTNFHWIFTSSTVSTRVDTGVVPSAAVTYYLRVQCNESVPDVTVELFDSTGTVLATITRDTTLPLTSTPMGPYMGIATTTNASKAWAGYFMKAWSK